MVTVTDRYLKRLIVGVQRLLEDIRDIRQPLKPPVIRQALDLLVQGLVYAREKLAVLDAKAADYADHPGRDPDAPLLRKRLKTMERLSIAFDIPLQATMMRAAVGLTWLADIAIGTCVAIGGALLARAAILWWSHVPNMTRRSIRRTKVVANGVGLVIVVCLGVMVVSRVAGPDVIRQFDLENWSLVAFSLLTEGLAILAGSLGAAAAWYSEPDEFDDHRHELRAAILWMEKTKEELERLLGELGDVRPPETASLRRAETLLRPVGQVVAAFAAVAIGIGSPADGWARAHAEHSPAAVYAGYLTRVRGGIVVLNSRGRPQNSAALTVEPGGRERCGVFIDITASGDSSARRTAVNRFASDLHPFLRGGLCEVIEIVWFSDRLSWAQRQFFQVPSSNGLTDCERVSAPASQGLAGVFRALKGFDAYAVQEAQRGCRTDSARVIAAWEDALAPVRAALGTFPTPEASRRTALDRLVRDIVASNSYSRAVVFTDGLDTADSATVPADVPADLDLTLVLYPATTEYGGESASAEAGDEWLRQVRGLRVLTFRELDAPHLWDGRAGGSHGILSAGHESVRQTPRWPPRQGWTHR